MTEPVAVGIVFPRPECFRLDLASLIEEIGFDSVWVGEHVSFHVPMFDGLTTLAAIAARTQRIRIGSAILLLPLRPPVPVAKAAAMVDVLSGGRLTLGVGVGGEFPKEFEACGVPLTERGARTDEGIAVLRKLWTEPRATFQGKFAQFSDLAMEPKPVQAGGPPIVIGGRSRAAMRRAARLGDGYMPYLFTPEQYAKAVTAIETEADAAGRSLTGFQYMLDQFILVDDDPSAAWSRANTYLSATYNQPFEKLIDRYCTVGPPEACVANLARYREAGVRHFLFTPAAATREEFVRRAERIAKDLIPALKRNA